MTDVVMPGPSGPIGAIDWGGSGNPLLLLHGGGTNAGHWAPLVPHADGWGWIGDELGYEANVAEMVADGCPEHCARRKHVRLPDGRYQVRPTAEFCAAAPDPANPLMQMDGAMYAVLGCPTLLVYGREGMAAHNREYIDAMPERFPMVSVAWMDGGHELDWERPELVAEHVKTFLGRVGGTS